MQDGLDPIIALLFVIFFGLSLGSFATAVIWRIPRGEQFIHGRSHCPSCGHALGIADLFPVLSWLWLRGKCRYCRVQFGLSYILVELATAALVTLVYLQFGITPQAGMLMAFATGMVILILTDLKHHIIPDGLNLFLLGLGSLYQLLIGAGAGHLLLAPMAGFSAGFALRWLGLRWKNLEVLSLGDVKFAAVAGMFISTEAITTFLLVSGVLGIVTAPLWKALGKGKRFPFGSVLCAAVFLCLLLY